MRPEKAVTMKVIAHVTTTDYVPIVGQTIRIRTYKKPCGSELKGQFEFNGETDQTGAFYASVVGYNLRNSEDEVIASAVAIGMENYIDANFSETVFSTMILLNTLKKYIYIFLAI